MNHSIGFSAPFLQSDLCSICPYSQTLHAILLRLEDLYFAKLQFLVLFYPTRCVQRELVFRPKQHAAFLKSYAVIFSANHLSNFASARVPETVKKIIGLFYLLDQFILLLIKSRMNCIELHHSLRRCNDVIFNNMTTINVDSDIDQL